MNFGNGRWSCALDWHQMIFTWILDLQIGQVVGLAIVMIFQGSLNTASLEQWGWRVPFLLAIVTGTMVSKRNGIILIHSHLFLCQLA